MENELVSNSGSTVTADQAVIANNSTGEEAEVASIEQDFVNFDKDFGTNLMAPETATPETNELDAVTKDTDFAAPQAESGGTLSLLEMADGNFGNQEEGFGSWVRDRFKPVVNAIASRAKEIIKKLTALARRVARKYRACVGKIVAAIKAYKAQQWGTAITNALAAFRCIKAA